MCNLTDAEKPPVESGYDAIRKPTSEKNPRCKIVSWHCDGENPVAGTPIYVDNVRVPISFTEGVLHFGCYRVPISVVRTLLETYDKSFPRTPRTIVYQH